jgi:hypothetical protein
MELLNIFVGEELESEAMDAKDFASTIDKNVLLLEIHIFEEIVIDMEKLLTVEWHSSEYDADTCIEYAKILWRSKMKLHYLRERLYEFNPSGDCEMEDSGDCEMEDNSDELDSLISVLKSSRIC